MLIYDTILPGVDKNQAACCTKQKHMQPSSFLFTSQLHTSQLPGLKESLLLRCSHLVWEQNRSHSPRHCLGGGALGHSQSHAVEIAGWLSHCPGILGAGEQVSLFGLHLRKAGVKGPRRPASHIAHALLPHIAGGSQSLPILAKAHQPRNRCWACDNGIIGNWLATAASFCFTINVPLSCTNGGQIQRLLEAVASTSNTFMGGSV